MNSSFLTKQSQKAPNNMKTVEGNVFPGHAMLVSWADTRDDESYGGSWPYQESTRQCRRRSAWDPQQRGTRPLTKVSFQLERTGGLTYTLAAAPNPPAPCHSSRDMDTGVVQSRKPPRADGMLVVSARISSRVTDLWASDFRTSA